MRKLDRRQFVVRSAGAASAAALALGAAPLRAGGANRRVVLGVMGTNGRGSALAEGFAAQEDCEIAYVCDPDERAIAKGIAAARRHQSHDPKGVADFRRILDDKEVDALVCAATDHWHAPATILACAAGKHVYVEKPASHNGQEGLWMIEAARKHDRRVQMGNQRRSSARIRELMERVQQGEIGRVLFARGWINSTRPSIGRGQQTAPPSWLDWDLWQGPAPERPFQSNLVHYNWHWFWHWGTGELGNNGIHSLDLCRWGLGVDWPDRVVCGGGKFHFDDDQQTPDTQIATFHFGNRAINWEHRTWHRRGFEGEAFGVTFYGERGTAVYAGNTITLYDMAGKQLEQHSAGGGDREHLANFLAAIRDGQPLNSEIEEGVKSTTICHLGNIAYRTGRTVTFDPQTRSVAGDKDAAALWTREYRPGWEPKV